MSSFLPRARTQYDDAELERRSQAEKQRKLEITESLKASRREARQKALENVSKATKPADSKDDSFTKRLLTKLINSLQIFVEQVRILIKSDLTCSSRRLLSVTSFLLQIFDMKMI